MCPPLVNLGILYSRLGLGHTLHIRALLHIRLGLLQRQLRCHQTPKPTPLTSAKFSIRSFLGNMSRFNNDYPFRPRDRRQSMRDEDDGDLLAVNDVVDCGVDGVFARAV